MKHQYAVKPIRPTDTYKVLREIHSSQEHTTVLAWKSRLKIWRLRLELQWLQWLMFALSPTSSPESKQTRSSTTHTAAPLQARLQPLTACDTSSSSSLDIFHFDSLHLFWAATSLPPSFDWTNYCLLIFSITRRDALRIANTPDQNNHRVLNIPIDTIYDAI